MARATATSVTAAVEVVPSGRALGAEVRGVDLSGPLPEALRAHLRAAWHEHLVLLFRGQRLTPRQYFEAASVFGTPQPGAMRAYFARAGRANPSDALGIDEISILSNLGPDGRPVMENAGLGSLEVVWHSDNSYIERPPAGSTLYAVEIPDDGSGSTSFSNQYLAADELPADLAAAVEGRRSKQDASRNSAGVLRPGVVKPERPEDVPGPMHPLLRIHPETGRRALYLGRRRAWPSQFIEGLEHGESEALLDRLWAHATRERYAWTHRWAVGDLLVWDNRCAMHYREPVNSTQRRVMWRSQFQGEDVVPG